MARKIVFSGICLLSIFFWAAHVYADTLEDAKKLMADKKYAEVDKVLERELAESKPSLEVLKLSFDAAIAGNRFVTAERRMAAILKLTGNNALDLLYQGGVCAERIGDLQTALARYALYAQNCDEKPAEKAEKNDNAPAAAAAKPQKNEKLERALNYILLRGAYPNEYKKYLKLYGANEAAWNNGASLLDRLCSAPDPVRALEIAELLLQNFKAPTSVDYVHWRLRTAAESFELGREPKDRFVKPLMLMAASVPSDYSHVWQMFQNAQASLTPLERFTIIMKIQGATKQPLRGWLGTVSGNLREMPEPDKLPSSKIFLALEPIFRDSPDRQDYLSFLQVIAECPFIYSVNDKVKEPPTSIADVRLKFDALKQKFADSPGSVVGILQGLQGSFQPNEVRADFLRKNMSILASNQVTDLVALTAGKDISAILAEYSKGRSYKEVLDARVGMMPWFNQSKDADAAQLMLSAAKDYMAAYPGNFNWQHIRGQFINSPLLKPEEKLALLKEQVLQAGYTKVRSDLLKDMANDKANWANNPGFLELIKAHNAKAPATDVLMKYQVAVCSAANAKEALEVGKKFLEEYKGQLPGGPEKTTNQETLLAYNILGKEGEFSWNNADDICALAELWTTRLPLGSDWLALSRRVREHGRNNIVAKIAPLYVALTKQDPGMPDVWGELANGVMTKGDFTNPLAEAYPKMGTDRAAWHVFNNRDAWGANPKFFMEQLEKAVAGTGAKFTDRNLANQLIHHVYHSSNAQNKIPPALTNALWDFLIASENKNAAYDTTTEVFCFGQQIRSGTDAGPLITKYLTEIQKRTPGQQTEAIFTLFRNIAIPGEPVNTELKPGMRDHTVLKVLKPVMEKVSAPSLIRISVSQNLYLEIENLLRNWTDATIKADSEAMGDRMVSSLVAGAAFDGDPNNMRGLLDILCRKAIAEEKWDDASYMLTSYAILLARCNNWDDNYQRISPIVALLDEKKNNEMIYAFISAIERLANPSDKVKGQLAVSKAKAGSEIKDLLPSDKNDPAYNLFLAAQSLGSGNDEHAWELTASKLPLLQKEWTKFDPEYVAWAADQMRKQKMYGPALEFVQTILLMEKDLTPEIAARVSLTKGDTYRDMGNYQAARIEYDGLRDNPRYNRTPTGSKGIWRFLDLLITTKDYTTATSLLERLIDSDKVETQAEAYYYFAKMAYQEQQYKEAKEYLKKVKDRVVNHVEAAFLEGDLNLVLPGGLQNSEVMVGNPRLALIAIPGRVLTLKLQDQNLSVARGGAAIPVVITTSKGLDEEHVKLLPSSTSKNLFVGQINTALGEVKKNDTLLELRGDDVISYEIEADFQKANDLKYPPKKLEVRYDARLVASSGEILTEEEEEKRNLEMQVRRTQQQAVDDTRRYEAQRDNRTVRPGSPIFVQVTDFARDISDAPDQIPVDLKTSSGDVIEGFKLVETGPHTGLFRAPVPTGIPLPKATTSDGTEGKDPSSLINTTKTVTWTSLSDDKRPKWIEVDTMSSQLAKSCSLDVPDSSVFKQLRVMGMLAENFEELASFPAKDSGSKGGLLIDFANDQRGESPDAIRRYMNLGGAAPIQQDKTTLDRKDSPFKGRDGWQTSRMRGTFWLADNKAVEFKFLQDPCQHGGWQHSYLFIDGQYVLGGQIDKDSVRITKKIDLVKGVHRLEVLDRCHWNLGKVTVGYRKDDGTFEPLPSAWFSTKDNASLAEFLKPKGRIMVEPKKITATLTEPVRLRKIRWEFEDFSGNSVSVVKVNLVNAEGKTVLPTASDFSSGLTNTSLEIAPGDQVTVAYRNEKRIREDMPILEAALNASFFNGNIILANESIMARPDRKDERYYKYSPAKRCRRGDQLMIVVTDYDGDISKERDTIPLRVTTSSGEKIELKALETWPDNPQDVRSGHAGVFMAVIRIGETTQGDQIKVVPGDQVTVNYIDAENTDPGVPVERNYSVNEAGTGKPEFLVYRTNVKQVLDTSEEAKAKLRRMRAKDAEKAIINKDITVATHPDYEAKPDIKIPAAKPEEAKAPAAKPAEAKAPAVKTEEAKSPAVPAAKDETPARPPASETAVAVNAPLLFEVNYPKMALNAGSVLKIEAVSDSELKAAKDGNRQPVILTVPMQIASIENLADAKGYTVQLRSHVRRTAEEMLQDGSFAGVVRLQIGSPGDPVDDMVIRGEKAFVAKEQLQQDKEGFAYRVPTLIVSGSDAVTLKVKDDKGQEISEARVRLLSDGRLELLDSSYQIQKDAIHLGEKFFVKVTDPDHDISNDQDRVFVNVSASSGDSVKLELTETLAHSGVFTGSIKPEYKGGFAPVAAPAAAPAAKPAAKPAAAPAAAPAAPAVVPAAKKQTADKAEQPPKKTEGVLNVKFGDEVTFVYDDDNTLSGPPMKVTVKGTIYHGSDAELSSFSKKFKDPEMAVKTNFLMAEALFEMAKEHRKLKQTDIAKEEIDHGKRILEEAMRDYPDTTLVGQGEFLLANLAQELENYQEAIGRYSHVINSWPESEYAARSQFKKAICMEKMEQYEQACEEYVKVTYIYPESNLVADSTVRLGNYYYKKEAYKVAGQIFYRFQQRNATHPLAAKSLFLAAQCYYKMKDYKESVKLFSTIVDEYIDQKDVREEAMYWLADSYFNSNEHMKAYQSFKKLTWDYPEGRWAKIARGRLTEEAFSRIAEEESK